MSRTRRRPDVVLIIADQWRGQDQGWIGNQVVQTPHLDALAERGVAVERAVANHPVCTPSRGDLLTGTLPHVHRAVANDLPLDAGVPTLADQASAAGYRTGWIGKWHLDGPPRDAGVADGRAGFSSFWSTNCRHRYTDAHYHRDGVEVALPGYEPEAQTVLAQEFLDVDDPAPALLVVSYGPPHDPYDDVPERYLDRYPETDVEVRANAADTAEARTRLRQYYAAITAVDEQIGRIVRFLAERDRLDETVIIVTADHGDQIGSHDHRGKQVPYAEAVRVPMVWHAPALLAPRRLTDGVFGLVDLAPTLLDLLDLPPLPDTYGRSLAPALRAGGSLRERAMIGNLVSVDEGWRQGVGEWRGFVSDQVSYARRIDGRPWLYFDDVNDPWQLDNLVDSADHDPSARSRIEAADRHLDAMLADAGDPATAGPELIRSLGLTSAWNSRERTQHGDRARVLDDPVEVVR